MPANPVQSGEGAAPNYSSLHNNNTVLASSVGDYGVNDNNSEDFEFVSVSYHENAATDTAHTSANNDTALVPLDINDRNKKPPGFLPPSSDAHNEYKMYGTQRVVIRRDYT